MSNTQLIRIPKLTFSHWVPWSKRKDMENNHFPGVYLIAISIEELAGKEPRYKDVSYIGMTNAKKGLYSRWSQFNNSIHGKTGHSGGSTIYKELGHYNSWPKGLKLYVSSMPVPCNTSLPNKDDLLRMGCVAYLEYNAFSEFMANTNTLSNKPMYNKR